MLYDIGIEVLGASISALFAATFLYTAGRILVSRSKQRTLAVVGLDPENTRAVTILISKAGSVTARSHDGQSRRYKDDSVSVHEYKAAYLLKDFIENMFAAGRFLDLLRRLGLATFQYHQVPVEIDWLEERTPQKLPPGTSLIVLGFETFNLAVAELIEGSDELGRPSRMWRAIDVDSQHRPFVDSVSQGLLREPNSWTAEDEEAEPVRDILLANEEGLPPVPGRIYDDDSRVRIRDLAIIQTVDPRAFSLANVQSILHVAGLSGAGTGAAVALLIEEAPQLAEHEVIRFWKPSNQTVAPGMPFALQRWLLGWYVEVVNGRPLFEKPLSNTNGINVLRPNGVHDILGRPRVVEAPNPL